MLTLPLPLPEPLSQPKIVGNSWVEAGSNTKLVCNVLQGKADAYWWMKNGVLLVENERIKFVENTTLCILRASISDSGYYTCMVSNAVSQNETSFLLKVHRECIPSPGREKNGGTTQERDSLSWEAVGGLNLGYICSGAEALCSPLCRLYQCGAACDADLCRHRLARRWVLRWFFSLFLAGGCHGKCCGHQRWVRGSHVAHPCQDLALPPWHPVGRGWVLSQLLFPAGCPQSEEVMLVSVDDDGGGALSSLG